MRQPRQILHLISSLDGYGESRQLRQLVEQQRADGCQVRIVAFTADPRERSFCEAAGAACRVLEKRWQYDPITVWRLARELREQPHDLLHIWGPDALRYAKFARSGSAGVPCVATLPQRPSERFDALADCFVVPNPQDSNMRDRGAEKTIVIPPGVASPTSAPLPRAEFLELLALPENARIVGIAGRLTRRRCLEEAIWCFELVRTIDERAKLLLFGAGPDRHRLERFARLASEPSEIRFLGYQDDLARWLPHVGVFWQTHGEQLSAGPSLAAIEAMALRVPVVATDVSAHRQLIEDGRTGSLFPAANRAIWARHTLRLFQDTEYSSAMAEAAAEEVFRRFSLSAFSNAYAELYERLLAGDG